MSRPNILYLHSHDTGRYVQPYGHAIETPRIQGLAEHGMLFRKAFCAASTCSASRACLLTGQYAHSNGMLGLAHRGWSLNDYSHHIVHTLRGAGYQSTLVGEQHISKEPAEIGYDRVIKLDSSRVEDVAPVAVDLLRDASPDQPFFHSIGFFETHREYFEPVKGEENYIRPPAHLPDVPETRRDMAAYVASARSLDRGVGAVLDALDRYGHRRNTLVICTTDHGIAFPGAKATMTDRGIGVMLIVRGPGGFRGGKASDALVSHIDLFPTICELLEIDRPPWLQGLSLMPIARGEADQIREAVFAEGTYHAAYEPQRCVRTTTHKYVRRFDPHDTPVLANVDDSPSKDVWVEAGWPQNLLDEEQLYDLRLDPNEAVNRFGDPKLKDVQDDLKRRLDIWMNATDDPLLNGPVPPPPGAEYNSVDSVSAGEPTLRG